MVSTPEVPADSKTSPSFTQPTPYAEQAVSAAPATTTTERVRPSSAAASAESRPIGSQGATNSGNSPTGNSRASHASGDHSPGDRRFTRPVKRAVESGRA